MYMCEWLKFWSVGIGKGELRMGRILRFLLSVSFRYRRMAKKETIGTE